MNTRNIAPPAVIKFAITAAIAKRSTDLVRKSFDGEMTDQEYHAMQFPADAIGFLEKAIDEAVAEYTRKMEELA